MYVEIFKKCPPINKYKLNAYTYTCASDPSTKTSPLVKPIFT